MKKKLEHKWRCERCGSLLGVKREGKLHLKYKAAQFIVEGTVLAICRRCFHRNETQSQTSWQGEDVRVLPHA